MISTEHARQLQAAVKDEATWHGWLRHAGNDARAIEAATRYLHARQLVATLADEIEAEQAAARERAAGAIQVAADHAGLGREATS